MGSYRISGSFDLFPQHCLLPDLSPPKHDKAVTYDLVEVVTQCNKKNKASLLKTLHQALQNIVTVPPPREPPPTEGETATTEGGKLPQRVGIKPPP